MIKKEVREKIIKESNVYGIDKEAAEQALDTLEIALKNPKHVKKLAALITKANYRRTKMTLNRSINISITFTAKHEHHIASYHNLQLSELTSDDIFEVIVQELGNLPYDTITLNGTINVEATDNET